MTYRATVHGDRFAFGDLRELLGRADQWKSGDELAGIAADGERERVGAKMALADARMADFHDQALIDDEVTGATRAGALAGTSGLLATRASGVSALLAGHHAKRIEP
jgi:ethanolamine ammonia-lyase large subunit